MSNTRNAPMTTLAALDGALITSDMNLSPLSKEKRGREFGAACHATGMDMSEAVGYFRRHAKALGGNYIMQQDTARNSLSGFNRAARAARQA